MSPPALMIAYEDGERPLVTIHQDGTITYGPDYTPDKAAEAFFSAVAEYFAAMMDERWTKGYEAGYNDAKNGAQFDG